MLTVYGHPLSPNARKVVWALEECGAKYDYKHVDIPKGDQKKPEFLKLNPNGRVPVLDDDGFVLWESNAILWYVADKFGADKIVPGDVKLRAQIDQWMWWQVADLVATARPWRMKLSASRGQALDEKAHAAGVEAAKQPLGILDGHLAGKKHAVGDRFTIADISLAEFVGLCDGAGIDLAPYAHIRSWIAHLAARPAYQKTRPPQK